MNLRAISEYIKLIPTGLKNSPDIVNAIITKTKMENGQLPEDQVKEIIRRRLICQACPLMSKNKKGYQSSRTDEHCTACGCPIETKTACLHCDCGDSTNPKWTKYESK